MSNDTELDPRTAVHHAIIDLFELRDYGEVWADDIEEYTGLSSEQVDVALGALEASGVIATDGEGIVVEARNDGYFPTTLQSH